MLTSSTASIRIVPRSRTRAAFEVGLHLNLSVIAPIQELQDSRLPRKDLADWWLSRKPNNLAWTLNLLL